MESDVTDHCRAARLSLGEWLKLRPESGLDCLIRDEFAQKLPPPRVQGLFEIKDTHRRRVLQ